MRYRDQLNIVSRLPVPAGETRRFDCFACGGASTLSVTRESGYLNWNCFRASCSVKGRSGVARSSAELVALFREHTEQRPAVLTIPDWWVLPTSNEAASEWLVKNHVMPAYSHRRVDLRYDPRQHRIVFLIRDPDNGEVVDAVGRALTKDVKPKWLRYGRSRLPFICHKDNSLAVLVEDAASACAVSEVATGVGLLGTHATDQAIGVLRRYERVIIALDPDARKRAIELHRLVSCYTPTYVRFISDDLKYFGPERIRQELGLNGAGTATS